jgi:hypothetical protein
MGAVAQRARRLRHFHLQFPHDGFHALLRVDCALVSGSPILVLGLSERLIGEPKTSADHLELR